MRKCGWLAVAFLVALSSGCAIQSSEKYAAYRQEVDRGFFGYFGMTVKDLVLDLLDIPSAELSFGPGFLLDVQPTKILEAGAGYTDTAKMGWRKRAFGFYREVRKEGGLSMLYYRHMDLQPIHGTLPLFARERGMRDFTMRHNTDRHWTDIGLQGHAVFFGAGAYVSPFETADFAVDVIAFPYNAFLRPLFNLMHFRPPEIDLADDDTTAEARKKHELPVVNQEEGFPPAETIDKLFRY
jgi:hypothetical protein